MPSDFVGRSKECEDVIASMMSQSKRVYSIWGPPGFGKTSTAIAIGNQLKHQGENVYYFSFRGVSTMKKFTSKLLGQFGRLIDLHPCVNIEPTDQLLYAFGSIKARMFVILDNLDDILTSDNQKEAMLNFVIDLLQRCPYVKFLTTTRESLESITLRPKEFDFLRLKPLDAQSSSSLVLNLLQPKMADLQSQISKMCGNVPLAIQLLCSLIKDRPQELLDEIVNGSECFLDVIDDDGFPADARLKELIKILFNKLSDVEKNAFISLSLFGGAEFGLDAGIAIVGGSKFHAKRSIGSLKEKSLIDIDGEMCEIHPLIQSFASEKGQNEMKNVLASSRTRFFEYYINLFENLNMHFLKGQSMSAFEMFFMEEQRIFTSLTDGLSDSKCLEKIVSILKQCELFLDALYHNNLGKIKDLYNSALSKVSGKDHAELYSSSVFFQTIIVTKMFCPSEEDETSREIALLPLSVQAKLECYKGIYVLSNGGGEPAAQRIEAGLIQLENNNLQHVILKALGFQLLAIFYKSTKKYKQFLNKTAETCTANSVFRYVPLLGKPVENEEKACFGDQPLAAWAMARLSLWTRNYLWLGGTECGNSLALFLKQISVEASKLVWTIESCTLLQLIDKAHIFAGIKYEVLNDEDGDQALTFEREATRYHTLAVNQCGDGESSYELYLKELEIRKKLPPNSKLADCYKHIGIEQRRRRQYSSAVDSHMFARQVFQQHYGHGEMHEDVAKSYCRIADAQENMRETELSIQSYRSALEIYLHLYGDCHLYSVMIKERINCLSKCPLVCTSIECRQNLLNLHSYLYSNNFSLRCRGLGRREQVTEKCCCVLI